MIFVRPERGASRFIMRISFDEDDKSKSMLDIGNQIYPYNESFDYFTNYCKNKLYHVWKQKDYHKIYMVETIYHVQKQKKLSQNIYG